MFDKVLRELFFAIDSILYDAIDSVYAFIIELASLGPEIFTEEILENFANTVFTIMGVFVLFNLAFKILQAIANPDSFMDKEKGGLALVKRIIFTLCLIVIVPIVFRWAYKLQTFILEEQVIPSIILSATQTSDSDKGISVSQNLAFYVFSPFVNKNAEAPSGTCVAHTYYDGFDASKNIQVLSAGITEKKSGTYCLNYSYFLSTAVMAVTLIFLLITTVDVSLRMIKLGFLQLISPIAIMTYIDAKSSKNGVFSKWVKVCSTTYLDLFIKIIGLSFLMFMVRVIDSSAALKEQSFWVTVLLILGALMFIKVAPKLIEDLTGIKMSGKFTLNPMAKLREIPVAGTAVSTVTGALGGAASGLVTGGVSGMATGLLLGGRAGAKNVPVGGMEAGKSQVKRSSWGAGADAYAQAYTGDKNAQGGLGNHLFNRVSQVANTPMYEKKENVDSLTKELEAQDKLVAESKDAVNEATAFRDQAKARLEGQQDVVIEARRRYTVASAPGSAVTAEEKLALKQNLEYAELIEIRYQKEYNDSELALTNAKDELKTRQDRYDEIKGARKDAKAHLRHARSKYVNVKE